MSPPTRSIGINAVPAQDVQPRQVPSWEMPAFSAASTGATLWQELYAEAGDSMTLLLASSSTEGIDTLVSASQRSQPGHTPVNHLQLLQIQARILQIQSAGLLPVATAYVHILGLHLIQC